jgi:hypothetical protein
LLALPLLPQYRRPVQQRPLVTVLSTAKRAPTLLDLSLALCPTR